MNKKLKKGLIPVGVLAGLAAVVAGASHANKFVNPGALPPGYDRSTPIPSYQDTLKNQSAS